MSINHIVRGLPCHWQGSEGEGELASHTDARDERAGALPQASQASHLSQVAPQAVHPPVPGGATDHLPIRGGTFCYNMLLRHNKYMSYNLDCVSICKMDTPNGDFGSSGQYHIVLKHNLFTKHSTGQGHGGNYGIVVDFENDNEDALYKRS